MEKLMDLLVKIADFLDQSGLEKEANLIDALLIKEGGKKHKCGLLVETVENHKDLLSSYDKAMKANQKEYKRAMEFRASKDGPNTGDLRRVLRELSHNCNAVKLHTMYFEDIIESKPYEFSKTKIASEIKKLYGYSSKDFLEHLYKAGRVPRSGWVILSYSSFDGNLYIDIIDLHEIGAHLGSTPLLAIDLWEHAYFADFGNNRDAYMDWVLERIDWRKVDKRYKKVCRGILE